MRPNPYDFDCTGKVRLIYQRNGTLLSTSYYSSSEDALVGLRNDRERTLAVAADILKETPNSFMAITHSGDTIHAYLKGSYEL